MKKLFLLALTAGLSFGCSDSDNNTNTDSANAISTIVVDGISFEPNGAYYYVHPIQEGNPHREITFFMTDDDPAHSLRFQLNLPFSKTNIAGVYKFSPGTADELLVNGDFDATPEFYAIVGATLTVADLGESRFKLTLQEPVALDVIENFTPKPMSGEVEATFSLFEN